LSDLCAQFQDSVSHRKERAFDRLSFSDGIPSGADLPAFARQKDGGILCTGILYGSVFPCTHRPHTDGSSIPEHAPGYPAGRDCICGVQGHIGCDFDLPLFEAAAEAYEIPLIRLETDYYHYDMEQLRIRLEAFSEILRHKVRTKGKDHA
ncbi:MAG: 2-hydroxyacyl-CoA dehydratase, partial [Oscillospiraceae bacterium]|nr:2-hydroxyacyl-CoA dehydratase [Oscillospiraceae bacterium]